MTTSSVQSSSPYRHDIVHVIRRVASCLVDVDVNVNVDPVDTIPSGSVFEERATVQCSVDEDEVVAVDYGTVRMVDD